MGCALEMYPCGTVRTPPAEADGNQAATKREEDAAASVRVGGVNHGGVNVLGAPENTSFAETRTEDHTFDSEMGASHTTSADEIIVATRVATTPASDVKVQFGSP